LTYIRSWVEKYEFVSEPGIVAGARLFDSAIPALHRATGGVEGGLDLILDGLERLLDRTGRPERT
jgi:hypothetical protein